MSAKPAVAKKPVAKKTPVAKKPAAKKAAAVVEPVAEVAAVPVASDAVPAADAAAVVPAAKASKSVKKDKKPRTRREISRESVDTSFADLQKKVEEEIEKLRASTEKVKGVKFLRTVNKAIKLLRNDTRRVLNKRHKSTRPRNTESGFMKPVRISEEMSSFTGWDIEKLYSRVEVTKFICEYVKKHDLQNPKDRRQINPDSSLSKLLKWDAAKADPEKPLTYFRIQQLIQSHFFKDVVVQGAEVAAVDDTEEVEIEVEEA